MGNNNQYTADSIKVFKGLDAVRKRPGMYIGNVNDASGLNQMAYEVIDNAIDEVLAGYATNVVISIHPDNSLSVSDNGRGIPVEIHKEEKVSAAELIMTRLHAGGKFDDESYKVSGGLHGVGVSVVNALSSWLELNIKRSGKEYTMRFEDGKTVQPLKLINSDCKTTGTTVKFLPSKEVFSVTKFNFKILTERLRELAFLNKEIKISIQDLSDLHNLQEENFHYTGGIKEYVEFLNNNKSSISPVIYFCSKDDKTSTSVEIAMQWTNSYQDNIVCFTNNIKQADGGTHLSGFKSGLTKGFLSYAQSYSLLKKTDPQLLGEDIREGLICVLSVKMSEPSFASQTKEKLVSESVRSIVDKISNKEIFIWLEKNINISKKIIEKIKDAAQARLASKKARELSRKKSSINEISTLPGKLADCQEKKPEHAEVLIVEGDSAGGTAKQGRDRKYQAVLPIRGKVLNVEKARLDKIFHSDQIKILISAIGAGIGKDEFDINKVRYHKIIIMTDADVDGAHIRTLLLTFFFRNMPQIIEKGYLYIAQPPLYYVKYGGNSTYIKDENQFQDFLINHGMQNATLHNTADNSYSNKESKNILTSIINLNQSAKTLNIATDIINILGVLAKQFNYYACMSETDLSMLRQNFNDKIKRASKIDATEKIWQIKSTTNQVIVFKKESYGIKYDLSLDIKSDQMQAIQKHCSNFADIFEGLNKGFLIVVNDTKEKIMFHNPIDLITWITDFGYKKLRRIQRFKGLGEMNADQLKHTTLDPKSRTLIKVKVENAMKADEIFSTLMGDMVEPRRNFIQQNALNVSNLDV